MALKQFFKKIPAFNSSSYEKKRIFDFTKRASFLIYPVIVLVFFIIYTSTYKFVNNQKSENEKNLEDFFSSQEFAQTKSLFFDNFRNPYVEFNYIIENNDSWNALLRHNIEKFHQ